MKQSHADSSRRGEQPYVFAYDIACKRRWRRVFQCLRRWRVDGQLSVHETWLYPSQARELSSELLDLIDRKQDKLLVCRLDRRGQGPIYQVSKGKRYAPLAGAPKHTPLPDVLHDGWYLLVYDITDNARLQRIQRLTVKQSMQIQRSVYLFHGAGNKLSGLIGSVAEHLRQQQDDLRLYALSGAQDIWFLSGGPDTMAQARVYSGEPQTWWKTFVHWIRT